MVRLLGKTPVLLFWFTFCSVVLRGYQYGSGNQVHYFNFAFHRYYPDLFAADYLFRIHDLPYTVFVDLVVWMLRVFGEQPVAFFLLYFLVLYAYYAAIWAIAWRLFSKRSVSWAVLTLFLFPIPIGGSTIHTLDRGLMPRFLAETMLLVSVYFLLLKRFAVSGAVAGMGFLVHPLTMLPFVPVAVLDRLLEPLGKHERRSGRVRQAALSLSTFFVISIPLLWKFFAAGPSGSFFVDSGWLAILRDRLLYLFIQHWSPVNFASIAVMTVVFLNYRKLFKTGISHTVVAVILSTLTIFFIALASSLWGIRLGLQLQLARNLYLFVVLFLIAGAGSVLARMDGPKRAAVTLATALAFSLVCLHYRTQNGILWMQSPTPYQQAALWAKAHSDKDSLFLVPLDAYGFRFWSKRSAFVEHKEGGDGLYERDFAFVWHGRSLVAERATIYDSAYYRYLKSVLGVDYVVTQARLPETVMYRNAGYSVYRL